MKTSVRFLFILCWTLPSLLWAQPSQAELTVWVNEAVISTYTFDYKNVLEEQKTIARYYTSAGWQGYSRALASSGLLDTVQKNAYYVSSVPTFPPEIKMLSSNTWQAVLPIMVVYKNPQYQQKQTLTVTLTFTEVPNGGGVRGLAVTSLNAVVAEAPCQCKK